MSLFMSISKGTKWILECLVFLGVIVSAPIFAGEPHYPNGFFVEGGGGYEYLRARALELSPSTQVGTLHGDNTSTEGAAFFGKFGYQLGIIPLSIELEFSKYSKLPYNESPVIYGATTQESMRSDVKGYAGFLDGRYFFNLGSDYFVPYVMAGLGVARNEVDMTATNISTNVAYKADEKKNGFAWQAGLGLRIKTIDNVFFDLSGRYMQLGKAQWGPWGPSSKKITTNTIESVEALASLVIFFGNQHPQRPPSLIR